MCTGTLVHIFSSCLSSQGVHVRRQMGRIITEWNIPEELMKKKMNVNWVYPQIGLLFLMKKTIYPFLIWEKIFTMKYSWLPFFCWLQPGAYNLAATNEKSTIKILMKAKKKKPIKNNFQILTGTSTYLEAAFTWGAKERVSVSGVYSVAHSPVLPRHQSHNDVPAHGADQQTQKGTKK